MKTLLLIVGLLAAMAVWPMIVGILVAIVVLAIVIILLLANLGAFFTKIAQGTTAFISAGDSLQSILPNVGGYRMSKTDDLDGRRWLVPENDENERLASFFHNSLPGTIGFQKFLWKRLGVRFISLFWPHTHVYEFDLRKGGRRRIATRAEMGKDADLRSRIVDSPELTTIVDSLLFLVPRPVYVEGVELAGDNSSINLLLLPAYRQVIPSLPAYYLKGDFFTLLDAAIEAAMVDFFARHRVSVYKDEKRKGQFAKDSFVKDADEDKYEESPLTYAHWLKLPKGEGSQMEHHLRSLNFGKAYLAKLKAEGVEEKGEFKDKFKKRELIEYIEKHLIHEDVADILEGELAKMIPGGIVARFGFALISFRVVEWEAHGSTKALAEALLAKETEFHKAEGVRQKARGEGDAKKLIGTGESARFDLLMKSLTDKKVDANVAARVVETMLRTENLRYSTTLTTYVEGGASASVMVPASPPTSTK